MKRFANGVIILVKTVAMPEWVTIQEWEQEFFQERGFRVKLNFSYKDEKIFIDELQDVDGLILGLAKATGNVIRECTRLKVIAKFGIGVDNIDIQAATKEGVLILNVPYIYAEPTANFTVLLILALTRKLMKSNRIVWQDKWKRRRSLQGISLDGKTLGVVGLGNIGSRVAEKCRTAFKMKVLAYDPYITPEKSCKVGAKIAQTLEELLRESDIVSLHIPMTEETHHIIGEKEIGYMKSTAFLVNTSRGGVVDEQALAKALQNREIAGLAVDVFTNEPPDPNSLLLNLENVIATPHIASSTTEANLEVHRAVIENVCEVVDGKMPHAPSNIVNKGVLSKARAFINR
jgi:D-3-phosphoglycerate dehydrogenase